MADPRKAPTTSDARLPSTKRYVSDHMSASGTHEQPMASSESGPPSANANTAHATVESSAPSTRTAGTLSSESMPTSGIPRSLPPKYPTVWAIVSATFGWQPRMVASVSNAAAAHGLRRQ
eukprot:518814-Prymnesium_polylepis.2